MISCSSIRENICAYIDNELDKNEKISFEQHVKNCKECKHELDEMSRIVELCTGLPQQELPADFNMELHEKLLAVAGRQENKVSSINKSKGFRFVKVFGPIAAALLLIFLAGNFFRNGFFSSMKAENSANILSMAAEKPVNGISAKSKADSQENGIIVEFSEEKANEAAESFSGEFAVSGSTETDRSSGVTDRQGITALESMEKTETAGNKSSTITITSADVEAQIEKINSIAMENSAETALNDIRSGSEFTASALKAGAGKNESSGSESASEPARQQLNFMVPDTNYDQFVSALNMEYGAANVQAGAFITEDLTELLNSSITKSSELDLRIQELQKKDSLKNSDEINNLKTEKESVDALIEKIRLESDFVNVTVFIDSE